MTDSTDTMDNEAPKKRRFRFPLPLLILAGGLAAAFGLVASRPQPDRTPTPRVAPSVRVETLTPRSEPIFVEGTGTVRPTSEIQLSAEVSGRVISLSPRMVRGGSFQVGDTLLIVDGQSYTNAVAIARAEVEQREVEVQIAEQEQVIAREEYLLLQQRTGRAVVADTSRSAQLALQQPQVEAAQASLHRAEAQLADAVLDRNRTVVTAPFSGRVRTESVDVGQFITSGQAFADIYSTDAVEVDVSISTRQALLIEDLWAGATDTRIPATVRADFGDQSFTWEGYVENASGALDPTTRTVEIVVRVPDPFDVEDDRPPLLVGSYARATIEGRRPGTYYAVPRPALRSGPTVWVVDSDSRIRSIAVDVIQEVEDTVFLRADVEPDTRIVVSDLTVMTDGMEISLAGEGASR
jgi:RND family efflux transporter MFP subunit